MKKNVLHAKNKVINLQSTEPRIGILLDNMLNKSFLGTTTLGTDVIYVESLNTWELIA